MDPLEIVQSTADPGFATDEAGRVVCRMHDSTVGYQTATVTFPTAL
jgi:hypothetical protein